MGLEISPNPQTLHFEFLEIKFYKYNKFIIKRKKNETFIQFNENNI